MVGWYSMAGDSRQQLCSKMLDISRCVSRQARATCVEQVTWLQQGFSLLMLMWNSEMTKGKHKLIVIPGIWLHLWKKLELQNFLGSFTKYGWIDGIGLLNMWQRLMFGNKQWGIKIGNLEKRRQSHSHKPIIEMIKRTIHKTIGQTCLTSYEPSGFFCRSLLSKLWIGFTLLWNLTRPLLHHKIQKLAKQVVYDKWEKWKSY